MGQDSTWHITKKQNQYVTISNNPFPNTSVISNAIEKQKINDDRGHSLRLSNNGYSSSLSLSGTKTKTISVTSSTRTTAMVAVSLSSLATVSSEHQQQYQSIEQNHLLNSTQTFIETALKLVSSESINLTESSLSVDDVNPVLSNWLLFILIAFYCIIVFGGIFGNASLVITLYTQSSTRLRNPLLVALCMADLMVSAVAAPLTVATLLITNRHTWSHSSDYACKSIYFMQVSLNSLFFPFSKVLLATQISTCCSDICAKNND